MFKILFNNRRDFFPTKRHPTTFYFIKSYPHQKVNFCLSRPRGDLLNSPEVPLMKKVANFCTPFPLKLMHCSYQGANRLPSTFWISLRFNHSIGALIDGKIINLEIITFLAKIKHVSFQNHSFDLSHQHVFWQLLTVEIHSRGKMIFCLLADRSNDCLKNPKNEVASEIAFSESARMLLKYCYLILVGHILDLVHRNCQSSGALLLWLISKKTKFSFTKSAVKSYCYWFVEVENRVQKWKPKTEL